MKSRSCLAGRSKKKKSIYVRSVIPVRTGKEKKQLFNLNPSCPAESIFQCGVYLHVGPIMPGKTIKENK